MYGVVGKIKGYSEEGEWWFLEINLSILSSTVLIGFFKNYVDFNKKFKNEINMKNRQLF